MVELDPPYKVLWTSQYKKDVKRAKKRNYNMEELYDIVSKLAVRGEAAVSMHHKAFPILKI